MDLENLYERKPTLLIPREIQETAAILEGASEEEWRATIENWHPDNIDVLQKTLEVYIEEGAVHRKDRLASEWYRNGLATYSARENEDHKPGMTVVLASLLLSDEALGRGLKAVTRIAND